MWPPPKEMVVNFTSLRTEMTCYKFTICGRAGVSTLDCLRKKTLVAEYTLNYREVIKYNTFIPITLPLQLVSRLQ